MRWIVRINFNPIKSAGEFIKRNNPLKKTGQLQSRKVSESELSDGQAEIPEIQEKIKNSGRSKKTTINKVVKKLQDESNTSTMDPTLKKKFIKSNEYMETKDISEPKLFNLSRDEASKLLLDVMPGTYFLRFSTIEDRKKASIDENDNHEWSVVSYSDAKGHIRHAVFQGGLNDPDQADINAEIKLRELKLM